MKKALLILFVLFSLALYAQTDTITILHVNDTHSTLAPLGPRDNNLKGTVGGIARAATLIGMTKMTEPNVLTLHGGDVFVGDIFFNKYFGVAEFQIMNSLGFDAMGVGNHEFDLTPAALQMALDSSFLQFPLISSNLILDGMPSLGTHIKDHKIQMLGNTKVGIFGLTTPETNVFSLPAPVVIDTGYATRAQTMVTNLKNQGCKVIICLSHLGIYYDMGLAAAVPGIDVIISAHDHYRTLQPVEIPDPVNNKVTYIVQTDAFYQNIGKLKLAVTGNTVSKLSYESIMLDSNIPEEHSVDSVVNLLIADIENTWQIDFFSQEIGLAMEFFEEVADSLTEIGKTFDTPVGNLVTDAYRWKTGTQIAIQVGGSTAQPLYQGKLVPVDIFRMIGYGFNEVNGLGYRLVTFQLKGTDLWTGLEIGLQGIELNDELLPQVSGLIYKFDPAQPPFSRVQEVYVNGIPVDTGAIYSVTANEFLVAALAQFGVNILNPVVDTTLTEFQAVMEYVGHLGGAIWPVKRGYVYTSAKGAESNSPREYMLEQNYPNPFNPSTVIRYHVPEQTGVTGNERVQLKVFDALGREVATLVNEIKAAGDYEVTFDASGYTSGAYFYEIRLGAGREVKKMLYIK